MLEMKILVFNWRDIKNPEAGGAEVHIHEILKRLSRRGHKITLVTSYFKGASREEIVDGIRIKRVGNKYLYMFFAILYYLRARRRETFDVVIDDISKIPLFTPIYVRKPRIAIVHHVVKWAALYDANPLVALVIIVAWALMTLIYKRTPIVVVSESTRSELVKKGIPKSNVHVIHNGIDPEKYSPGAKSRDPLITYFGRIKKYKRIEHLIIAFRELKKEVPGLKLVIAGKGDYKPLKNPGDKLGVKLIGEVPEERKVEILRKSWVLANPSIEEGWGITVIEANACGTPVVGYNVPGLRDSIKHGYNGLLVENGNIKALANALKEVLLDEQLRAKLCKNAVEWAKRFSWDEITTRFENLLTRVLRDSG